MIARLKILLSVLCFTLTVKGQPGFGESERISENWAFYLNRSDTSGLKPPPGVSWESVDLPHDWSVRQPLDSTLASCMGYLPGGIGWYKKNLKIGNGTGKVYLYFEGVYNRSEIFVNGKPVGARPNGYISVLYDITPYVLRNQQNEVLVKVDHHRAADSRWYTGSGIYRDVWLVTANPVHIGQWGLYAYPQMNGQGGAGTIKIEVAIENTTAGTADLKVRNELIDKKGSVVAAQTNDLTVPASSSKKLQTQLDVQNPMRWNLSAPHLYELRTTVFNNGKKIDAAAIKTGFRQFTFDPDKGFALNGQWMKLKGVCVHHDAGVLGAAMYKDVWKRRILNLKKVGCNAIRTSHNPQATAFYELCDELGMLVLNEAFDEWEFPKRKWLQGWNIGKPGFQGSYDFFEQWGSADLADMVKRDRNHVSIFAWSIGNEVDYPNDPYSHPVLDGQSGSGFTQKMFGGYKKEAPDANRLGMIAKRLVAVVKQYDQSRPVTAGLAGVAMSNETEYPSSLDIAGYNYTESRYEIDHKKYPTRVIYGSENRHDFKAWKAVTANPHIFGQFLWTGIDYLGESGKWPSRGFYSGLLDFAGLIKPRGYYRMALWSENPVAYLGTYPVPGTASQSTDDGDVLTENEQGKPGRAPSMDAWPGWNYKNGDLIRVVCYTNASKARLLLNGSQIGEIKDYDTATGIIYWDIPFRPGKLEVEGIDGNGKVVSFSAIQTPGIPAALRATVLSSKGNEVTQVLVEVVDKEGIVVTDAREKITCTISGPAKLLGMEAGNNRDMGDYTDAVQTTYKGKLVTYIRSKSNAPLNINFTAPGGIKAVQVKL